MEPRKILLFGVGAVMVLSALAGCATMMSTLVPAAPPAEIEYPGEITLPRTFEDVWYRGEDRGFSLRAYSSSGILIVSDTQIEFYSGSDSMVVPVEHVQSLSWGKVGSDTSNDWATVRFSDGTSTTAALFRDGSSLGSERSSDDIYSTLKYAAEVIGGVAPNPESFNSGWLNPNPRGLTGGAAGQVPITTGVNILGGELTLEVGFQNKAPGLVWVMTSFRPPSPLEQCDVVHSVAAGAVQFFECPQAELIAAATYMLLASVYSDDGLQTPLERNAFQFEWTENEVAETSQLQERYRR